MTIRTPPGTHSPGWMYGLSFTAPRGTNIAGFRRHVEGQVVQVPGAPPPWSWDYMEGGTAVGEDEYEGIRGSSNMGPFEGDYNPHKREVECELAIGGGVGIPGSGGKKSKGDVIKITGRKLKDPKTGGETMTAEVDGKNAVLVMPPPGEDE